jgi:hypothetical protein
MTTCPILGGTPDDLVLHLCAPTATRTRDLLLRRQSLYPLSYRGPTLAYRADKAPRSPGGSS